MIFHWILEGKTVRGIREVEIGLMNNIRGLQVNGARPDYVIISGEEYSSFLGRVGYKAKAEYFNRLTGTFKNPTIHNIYVGE